MAEPALAKKRYTYDDYLKTPDDERYELENRDSDYFLKKLLLRRL